MMDEKRNPQAKGMEAPEQEVGGESSDLSTVAVLAKCLADPNRLRILLALGAGRRPVSAIVEEVALSQPLVSHHLKELRRALLVEVERSGPFVYYELADPRILQILDTLRAVGRDRLAARTALH